MSDNQIPPGEATHEIEGLIFKESGTWVAVFDVLGQKYRSKIDYCPWCGIDLDGVSDHKH